MGLLSYGDIRRFEDKLDKILANTETLKTQGADMDATIQQVKDDLDSIIQEAADYKAARDAIDVTLNQQITDLTAQLAAGTANAAQVQAGINDAFTKAETAKAALAPPGASVLASSYPDNPTFTAAVAAYTGGSAVTLDAAVVKPGSAPSLDYFTHSDSTPPGAIDTTGPTS